MKGFVVKITRLKWWLDLVAPYTCRGCGVLGTVLCECCKNNILRERVEICPSCKQRLDKAAAWCGDEQREMNADAAEVRAACGECELPFERLRVVGWREGLLKRLVEEYKYQGVRELDVVLAELALAVMGEVGENVVVVPLPTIGRHVRQRGLDHTWRLAREMAHRKGWGCRRVLRRAKDTVQVGAKQAVRETQARGAYEVTERLEAGRVKLRRENFSLSQLTRSTLEKLAPSLEAQGLRLSTALEDPAPVLADRGRMAQVVENLYAGLNQADPDHQEQYRENAVNAMTDVSNFGVMAREILSTALEENGVELSGLVTFHDGFRYFAQFLDVPLLASIEEEEGSEASAKEINEITALVKEYNLPVIFTEVNGSDATAQAISRETGCAVAQLTMLMDGPDGGTLSNDYCGGLMENIRAIVNGFAGEEVLV